MSDHDSNSDTFFNGFSQESDSGSNPVILEVATCSETQGTTISSLTFDSPSEPSTTKDLSRKWKQINDKNASHPNKTQKKTNNTPSGNKGSNEKEKPTGKRNKTLVNYPHQFTRSEIMNELPITSNKTGFVTTVKPTSSSKFSIKNDDKVSSYKSYENKAHPEKSKLFNLVAPDRNKTNHKWKYFHIIDYHDHLPRTDNSNHDEFCVYVCCNICGADVKYTSIDKDKKPRSTTSGMARHLKTHNIYDNNLSTASSTQTTPTSIPNMFAKSSDNKYKNSNDKQSLLNDKIFQWCVPATSAPSERIFSVATNIVSKKRARMDSTLAGDLIFLKQNLEWFQRRKEEKERE